MLPTPVKEWIHNRRGFDNVARDFYGGMLGSGIGTIESGPMKGLRLVLGRHVSHAHLSGNYELETQRALDQELRDGFVCYDLGASIGYLTLLMARKASRVFAFEPAPHATGELLKHVAANDFGGRVEIVGTPVSDSEREVTFALTDVAYGSGINDGPTKWPTLKLRSTTLDIFAKSHPAPDLIKIDVEGEEGRVLDGAVEILATKRPVIICEIHSQAAATHVLSVLDRFHYKMFELSGEEYERGDQKIIPGCVQVVCRPQ